jgi:quercetin dioxygenase-like cupin family protein
VLGVGVSLLYSVVANYFRIHERFRLCWHSLKGNRDDWHKSGSLRNAKNFLTQTPDGAIQLIVTPETAMTNTLNVSLLTLHPGREIPPTISVGVEFYYVLEGVGRFSQTGVIETAKILTGDCFVVYPGSTRWISNNNNEGNEDNLILLRATDGGTQYNRRQLLDIIRMDPNYRKKNTIERLRDGIQQLNEKTKDYIKESCENLASLRLK